jgi:SAM-dependent methyltransferase
MLEAILDDCVQGKQGLEIGGPSSPFAKMQIYSAVETLDNVVFSADTVWMKFHDMQYRFHPQKEPGKLILADAVDLTLISDQVYDCVLSSHTLEHIANPIKAMKEWIRVTRPGGTIVLILPEKSQTFDHKRDITSFGKIVYQFESSAGEDDLSSLGEVLKLHDLTRDPPAGALDQFLRRSLDNYRNRCLHHHVFDAGLLRELSDYLGCKWLHTETRGMDIWAILQIGSS